MLQLRLPCSRWLHFSSSKSKLDSYKLDSTMNEDIANLLRIDSVRAIHVTRSGHPTSCASIAEIMSVLFFNQAGIKFCFDDTKNFLNDRLVLSKGHAAPILYSALYRAKVITQAQLMSLRLKGSIFEGHPTPKVPFVDVATGSLGQGLSVAAGTAYSSKYLDKITNRVYCITGDGQMAQGNIWEAADFAHNYKLNNLTLFIDVNRLGQSQPAMHGHQAEVFVRKFKAFGWNTRLVDGHSVGELVWALGETGEEKERPSVVVCKTFKGRNLGSQIEDKEDWHGKDLGDKLAESIKHLQSLIKSKEVNFQTFPPSGDHPKPSIEKVSITPNYQPGQKISTRKAYGKALSKAQKSNQNILSLDADTKNSTFSLTLKQQSPQSFIECYIAEQNMIGIAIGLSCRYKIPFCSSFAAFLMRATDQIRIAGIGGNAIRVVGSHSGCSVGEDGPSQMGLEDLGFYRALPKGIVLVPSDGVSMEKAVQIAGNYNDGPSYIRTSRPDLPILYPNNEDFVLGKCKVLKSSSQDKAILISHGVTVHECLKAYQSLLSSNINVRVLDIFCLKPLDKEEIIKNIKECKGNVIIVEEHYQAGGAHEAICGAAAPHIQKMSHLFVKSTPGSAKPQEQLQIQGLDAKSIERIVREQLSEKV